MTTVRSLTALLLAGLTAAGCGRDVLSFGTTKTTTLRIQPQSLDLFVGQRFSVDVLFDSPTESRSVVGEDGLTLTAEPADQAALDASGEGTALAPGEGLVRAEYEGFSDEIAFSVRDATLVGIGVEPRELRLAPGEQRALTVTGQLSDGTQVDLTAAASGTTYAAEPAAVASVSAQGVVTGDGEGAAVVRVTQGSFTIDVPVEVTADVATYVSIRIDPPEFELLPGVVTTFRVIGVTSEGAEVDLFGANEPVNLEISDPSVAAASPGRLEGLSAGGAVLTAQLGDLLATAQIRVIDSMSELVGIAVQPEFLNIEPGESVQLRVIGFFADGSTTDLTSGTTGTSYLVEDARVATVGPNGLLTAQQAGLTPILVRNGPFEAITFLEVVGERVLVGLEVQPQQVRLQVGASQQLTVLAFYSDGFVDNVTNNPNTQFAPSPVGIADVSPGGRVLGLAPGEDLIEVSFEGLIAPVFVLVERTVAQVVEVRVEPNPIRVDAGQPFFGLRVIAVLSDGSTRDVTGDPGLVITVDDPMIATWDGVALLGQAQGLTVVRGRFSGITGTARVQVSNPMARLLGIQINVPPQVRVGQTEPVGVFGFFSDGSVLDLTGDPLLQLSSDNPMIAATGAGAVTGVSAGGTTIRAAYQGFQANGPITVTPNNDPITRILFRPASLTVGVGQNGTARVIGIRASGAEVNLSADPALNVASSGSVNVSRGPTDIIVTGVSPGNGTVSATYTGGLSAQLAVTVQNTTSNITAIQIIAPGRLAVGAGGPFVVLGFRSDNTVVDLTTDPALTVAVTPAIATISGAAITANTQGTAQIVATYQGLTSQVTLIVTPATDTVTGLAWTPTSLSIPAGSQRSAQLTATFSSGATADVTFDPNVTYTFNGPIAPSPGPNGIVLFGQSAGTASVVATFGGQSATLNVTVTQTGPTLVRILLQAPANLDLGSPGSYAVIAEFSDGSSQDVTSDPALTVFVENPAIFSAAGGVLTPLQVGTTRLGVSFNGFSAQRTINVVNNNPFTAIRFSPTSLSLTVGQSQTVQVIGRRQNGATENLTSQVTLTTSGPITLGPAGTDVSVLANAPGSASVTATFGALPPVTLTVTIAGPPAPTITSLNPNAVLVGSPTQQLTVTGTGFAAGDRVVVDGTPVPTTVASNTTLLATLAAPLFTAIADLDVQVVGPRGGSNTVTLQVGSAPNVTSYTPNAVVEGSVIEVVAIGAGLTGLSVSIPGASAVVLSSAPDGSTVRIRITAPANSAGMRTLTLTNAFGSETLPITVTPATGQMDLVVTSGQVLQLSGTNVFNNVTVNTGGRILGVGTAPLAIIATGNITIRGSIDVSGVDGAAGFTNAGTGGAAGPGGGGGGGGGDGNLNPPASGGAGSPAGTSGGPSNGAGTPAGDGGGNGGGNGGSGGCGQGGGGGGLGGNGGSAGGDNGIGTGGAGGVSSTGSQFGGGTGGGGGSTCGPNGGGGGGGGGGVLTLQVALGGTILVDGRIDANGGDGGFGFSGTGGGGGGSGGLVEITAPGGTITVNDTISATGGRGGDADFGDGGGGGSGGLVIIDASPMGTVNTTLGVFDVAGGGAGLPLGTGFAGRAGAAGSTNVGP